MLFALTLTFIHVLNNEIFNSGFLLERLCVSGILPLKKYININEKNGTRF